MSSAHPWDMSCRDDQYWPTGDVVPGHSSWRSEHASTGGGALIEHSIHSADILCWLFGPARSVQARSRFMFGYDVEDVAALTIEHESGVVGTLLPCSTACGAERNVASRCSSSGDRLRPPPTSSWGHPKTACCFSILIPHHFGPTSGRYREEHFTRLGLPRRDFLFYCYAADRNWVHAVQDGTEASPGFGDALLAHELVDAAYQSARRITSHRAP